MEGILKLDLLSLVKVFLSQQEAVGLDIGSQRIKAIQIRASFKGLEVTRFASVAVPKGSGVDHGHALAETIKSMFEQHGFLKEPVISAVSIGAAMVRTMSLPFKDPVKARQAIPFELESHLPLPVDDLLVQSYPLPQDSLDRGLIYTAFGVRREIIEAHLKILTEAGLDPVKVGLDTLALVNVLLHFHPPAGQGSTVLLDIGAGKTTLVVLDRGKPIIIRCLDFSGREVTAFVAHALNISVEEAEKLKLARGRLSPPHEEDPSLRRDDLPLVAALNEVHQPLLKEIHRSVIAFMDETGFETINHFFVTGGGASLPGLDQVLSHLLEAPVRRLDFGPISFNQPVDRAGLRDISLAYGVSLGLAMSLPATRPTFLDFRQEEFAFKRAAAEIKGRLWYIFMAVVVMLLLTATNFFFNLNDQQKQYNELKKQVDQVFKSTLPEVTGIVNPVAQMQTKINELKKGLPGLSSTSQEDSALEAFRQLTRVISSFEEVRVIDLVITPPEVTLTGEAKSFNQVNKIQEQLQGLKIFSQVKMEASKPTANRPIIEFRYKITRREP
ncbi:MAG: pilus assembly protein PilM [Deltaproteobacteria bacterium]|nr:pilus assembly protein PilM [Deltaproteobacteria bacterium]